MSVHFTSCAQGQKDCYAMSKSEVQFLEYREMEPASADISIETPSLLNGTGTPIFITKL